jgi:TolA-binding protein
MQTIAPPGNPMVNDRQFPPHKAFVARAGRAYVLIAMALAGAVGCQGVPPAGRQMLERADKNYRAGEYQATEQSADSFLRQFGSSPAAAEAYYLRGLARARLGRWDEAVADLQRSIETSQREDLTAQAHAMLGLYDYQHEQDTDAIQHFEQALPHLAKEPPADDVQYAYAVCLQRLGQWDAARRELAAILHTYPNSDIAEAARRRFRWPQDSFSIQCGAFSKVDNANARVTELQQAGLAAKTAFLESDGGGLWRVYVGQYPTYAEAQAALPGVRSVVPGALIAP